MTLYVRSSGPDAAPTLLFLHGGGVGGWSWEPVVERLPRYHCLVPDLPEQGRSLVEGPFSISDATRRMVALIDDRAHSGHAHLIGISLGGQIALDLLSVAPNIVDRAVISGTLVRPIPGRRLIDLLARAYMPFRNIDFLVRANQRSQGVPNRYLPQFREDTRNLTAAGFARILSENASFHIPYGLRFVDVPTLVLVGERELGATRQSARDIVATLPNAQGRIAAGARHNWALEDPALFAETVQAWVENRPLPSGLLPLE